MTWGMASEAATSVRASAVRQPSWGVGVLHVLVLAAAGAVVVLNAGSARWNAGTFTVVAVFTVVSGLTYVETGSTRLKVSGSFLGLMLAAVLLVLGAAVWAFWLDPDRSVVEKHEVPVAVPAPAV